MTPPPTTNNISLLLTSPAHTSQVARDIAQRLAPGDVILLDGAIGTGKTHFCRSLIQSLMTIPEDVPSPTFTLVQIYDVEAGELWHADLYRLGHVDEVEELGLLAAFEDAICLVEWPDKLEDLTPAHALQISLSLHADDESSRKANLSWTDPKWAARLESL